jgi:hypothetical protein
MKVLPVGDDSTPTPTALSRVGVISHDSGGYPGDSIPFVVEYIVAGSWDQFGCANGDPKAARPTAIGRNLRSHLSFSSSSPVDFTCSAGIHHGNAKPYEEIRPSRDSVARRESGQNDGGIRHDVVAGRKERGETETPAVMTNADEQQSAHEIDQQSAEPCQ